MLKKASRFWLMFAFLLCLRRQRNDDSFIAAVIASHSNRLFRSCSRRCAVAFLSLWSLDGLRLVTGVLADKFGQLPTLLGAALHRGAAAEFYRCWSFADADHLFLFYAAFACIGFAFGSLC